VTKLWTRFMTASDGRGNAARKRGIAKPRWMALKWGRFQSMSGMGAKR